MNKYAFKFGDKVKVTGTYQAEAGVKFDGWSAGWDLVGLTGIVVGHNTMKEDEYHCYCENFDDEFAAAMEDSVIVRFDGHDDLEILSDGPETLIPARDLTKE